MVAPRLIGILKSFSPDEIKTFEKFLLSPFFNTSKIAVKFYRELVKFYPDFKSDLLTSEYIFSRMSGGKPFNKQTMWNLSSGLEKLAEEYLTHSALIKRPRQKFDLIFDELAKRKLGKQFKNKLRDMEKLMSEAKIDPEYFQYLGYLENDITIYWQKIRDLHDKDLENTFNFFLYMTINYLVNTSLIKNILDVNKENFDDKQLCNIADDFLRNINFEGIIEISKKNKLKYADVTGFYCNVILCSLDKDNEKHYFELKKFFFKNHDIFEFNEKRSLVTIIANYCVYKIQFGNSVYIKELFEVNKFRLEQRLATYDNGMINKTLYIQIVFNAASLHELQWTKRFVEEYTPLLFEEHRERMRNFAAACIYFETKKYDDVLSSLKKFKFIDVIEKIIVKNLIARSYYEMGEFELLLYHIDSTKHFLKNNKNLGRFRAETNNKFFNYLHALVTAIEKNDAKKLVELEENLKKDSAVNNKAWLLEKLNELNTDAKHNT